jgi:hypothetical protein
MPSGRVSMRQVREVLRLGFAGICKHEIARQTGGAIDSARDAEALCVHGLAWPLPNVVTKGVLEARLYRSAGTKQGHRCQVEPGWGASIARCSASTSHS